ncbi:MAG: 16S rRNA (cytidine(1402)-2'-O)-methyltransferase [Acidimicrobiia bacterium]|nr:16S rRNA (cytidine(1402)-2'-O)-methyltransferase [Acidimicrobiia bacterium]
MSGTLFVVATPIGNLEDISLRALRVLRDVAVIAAEDTRRAARLLARYEIPTPTVSFHDHNLRARLPRVLARLASGDDVALVSDAGMPGLNDPGRELVAACVEQAIPVDVLPGPNAAVTALVASGFPTSEVVLLGFPPSKGAARRRWLQRLAELDSTVVFYESPRRLLGLLGDLYRMLGERQILVARELTKLHQDFLRGTACEVLAALKERDPKGEITVVIGCLTSDKGPSDPPEPAVLGHEYGQLTKSCGFGRRAAISELSRRHLLSPREVYRLLEAAKG